MIYLKLFLAALALVLAANLKGHLFLGDAGTYAIGAFLGPMLIGPHHAQVGLYTMDVVTIVRVPVVDMIRLFGMRLARGRHPLERKLLAVIERELVDDAAISHSRQNDDKNHRLGRI